jgi:hypothetical protein
MTAGATTSKRPNPGEAEGELCVFNGIDGATGEYFAPPLTVHQVADLARREPRYHLPDARPMGPAASSSRPAGKAPGHGIDPRDLGQTGWGVVFCGPEDPEVRDALAPLLELRREQAGSIRRERYRELRYRSGDSKSGFLGRHGVPPGVVDPDRLPYYLLLVGDPEEIPFEVQYQLDVQYAVGRIHFASVEEYAIYAQSVVAAERGAVRRRPAAAFFAPRNPRDALTALSADYLAAPLAADLAGRLPRWKVRTTLGKRANRDALAEILESRHDPAILFTAGHGLCFHEGDVRQAAFQGSLICQDWEGPGCAVKRKQYFSADDLSRNARLAGLVVFLFSCFGAGTPRYDAYPAPLYGARRIAARGFLSRLARRLLAHPGGGALAVIGHVDRAMGWSFGGPQGREHRLRPVFENALKALAAGYPVGYAIESFNNCYAELATDLDAEVRRDGRSRDRRLAELWTNRNDARNYAVMGDPAVRLALSPEEWLR